MSNSIHSSSEIANVLKEALFALKQTEKARAIQSIFDKIHSLDATTTPIMHQFVTQELAKHTELPPPFSTQATLEMLSPFAELLSSKYERFLFWENCIERALESGDYQEATSFLPKLKSSYQIDDSSAAIINACIQANVLEHAYTVIEHLSEPKYKYNAFSILAPYVPEEKLQQFVTTVQQFSSSNDRNRGLSSIASSLRSHNNVRAALSIALLIEDQSVKVNTLEKVVLALLSSGDKEEALQHVSSLSTHMNSNLLEALIRINEIELAITAINENPNEYKRGKSRTNLCELLIDQGKWEQALPIIKQYMDDDDLDKMRLRYVDHCISHAQFQQAFEHTKQLQKSYPQAEGLIRIGTALLSSNDSSNLLEDILSSISSVTKDYQRDRVAEALSQQLIKATQLERAMSTIQHLPVSTEKSSLLAILAGAYITQGSLEPALTISRALEDNSDSAAMLSRVGISLAQSNQLERAQALFAEVESLYQSIPDQDSSFSLCFHLFQFALAIGEEQKARRFLNALKPKAKPRQLESVVSFLFDRGEKEWALKELRSSLNNQERFQMLKKMFDSLNITKDSNDSTNFIESLISTISTSRIITTISNKVLLLGRSATYYANQGELEKAEQHREQAYSILDKMDEDDEFEYYEKMGGYTGLARVFANNQQTAWAMQGIVRAPSSEKDTISEVLSDIFVSHHQIQESLNYVDALDSKKQHAFLKKMSSATIQNNLLDETLQLGLKLASISVAANRSNIDHIIAIALQLLDRGEMHKALRLLASLPPKEEASVLNIVLHMWFSLPHDFRASNQ